MQCTDKLILVTGAQQGIGRAMALTLIRYGANSSAIARVIDTTPPLLAT